MEIDLSFNEALMEVRTEAHRSLRGHGFRKTGSNAWTLKRARIVVRLRLNTTWRYLGRLTADLEAAPNTGNAFVEHYWASLPRLARGESAYEIRDEGERAAFKSDLESVVPEFVSNWEDFDDLWIALLHGEVRDDPSFGRDSSIAAISALEIAHYRDLGSSAIDLARSYIGSKGWKYRLLPDDIAAAYPELLRD